MGSKTYKLRAVVLRKTKLKDRDVIATMLAESGMLVQGVAKGARKPGGSLGARLELFSTVDALMAQGRSLDIVCEARLASAVRAADGALDLATYASPLAELVCHVAQPGLSQPRLFDMTRAGFASIARNAGEPPSALALCAASLWKTMAQAGFRPSISHCASCADELGTPSTNGNAAFSPLEGGIVCARCLRPADAVPVSENTAAWIDVLLRMRYDEISERPPDEHTSLSIIELAQLWIHTHVGRRLKSIDFLFASGLV